MTDKEAVEFGNMWIQINEDCKDSSTYEFFQMAIRALEERQQGEWICGMYNECPNDTYCKCNRCNYIDYTCRFSNFCPSCGAGMRKGVRENETDN